jgi:outer membrane autotransporter protein
MYGLYLKMGAPTPIGLYPYFIAGWTETKIKLDPKQAKSDDDKGGDITYGVGVDYWFTSNLAAGLEYAKYYDKDDYEISGASLNVKYKF